MTTDKFSFDHFLNEIGALATEDRKERQRIQSEEAPEFQALSFFDPGEVIATKILAYLLKPSAPHGQGDDLLKHFLDVLGIDLHDTLLRSVIIETNARCFTLDYRSNRRMIDLLIRFRAAERDYVIAIESKSHDAQDGKFQVHDYLCHIRKAYRSGKKYFYYLKEDGEPPTTDSISRNEWEETVKDDIRSSKKYSEVMSEWLSKCKACKSKKLQYFLNDFGSFLNLQEDKPMTHAGKAENEIMRIIINGGADGEPSSAEFDAIMEIYALHDRIWQQAIENCMRGVSQLLKEQLEGWVVNQNPQFQGGLSYFELAVWRKEWEGFAKGISNLQIIFTTEDNCTAGKQQDGFRGPTHLEIYAKKIGKLPTNKDLFYKKRDTEILRTGQEKTPRRIPTNGIQDIRNVEGIRYLLTSQAPHDVANGIVGFVKDHQELMDSCFV